MAFGGFFPRALEWSSAVSPHASAAGRPLKVLHVDDDPMNLRVVHEILNAFGHSAIGVSSGPQALERLERESVDLILLDIHMPDMSGIEVLLTLRSSASPGRHTPAIALTARSKHVDQLQGSESPPFLIQMESRVEEIDPGVHEILCTPDNRHAHSCNKPVLQ